MPKSAEGENMSRYYLAKYATFDEQYKIFDSEKIDGLYESFKVNEKTIEVSWENRWNGIYHHKTYDIVKQAEKIEDLFDEFVKDKTIVKEPVIGCYGAIWTNKGLIYLARFTEEEWEIE